MTKQLTSGIDTLVLALDVMWKDSAFFKSLQSIKEKAAREKKPEPGVIHYRENALKWVFSVNHYGLKGYEWFITSKDFRMRIGEWMEPQAMPSIMVEITSEALWRIGPREVYGRIIDIIGACGGIITSAKVTRVDLCMDILLDAEEFDDIKLRKAKVTRARKISMHFEQDTLETISFGKKKIMARLYDKEIEIRNSSKKFWFYDIWGLKKNEIESGKRIIRVEFEIHREIIKELGAGRIDELLENIDKVWSYCTCKWLPLQ